MVRMESMLRLGWKTSTSERHPSGPTTGLSKMTMVIATWLNHCHLRGLCLHRVHDKPFHVPQTSSYLPSSGEEQMTQNPYQLSPVSPITTLAKKTTLFHPSHPPSHSWISALPLTTASTARTTRLVLLQHSTTHHSACKTNHLQTF
jgi:hypothetical protein